MRYPETEKKHRKWYEKIFPLSKESNSFGGSIKDGEDTCVRSVIRPLRIFQFLVVLLIFVLIVYTIMLADPKLSSLLCILLIVLSGVYVFVLSIDLINQFVENGIQSIPMFIFSFLGCLLFGAAGIFILGTFASDAPWYILTIASALLLAWILFIIDVSLTMAFWKRNCNLCKQCCYTKRNEMFQKEVCHPLCTETVKRDLTTSVSSVKVPSGDENAVPDHSTRKVSYGHRRQYVDCPSSARKLALADAGDVQTERHQTTNIQSQTHRDIKETSAQTVSRCDLCNRQLQLFTSSMLSPTSQQPLAPCPALVQLLSGSACCPGCRCVTGIIQVSQQSQQQQTQKTKQPKEKEVEKSSKDRSSRRAKSADKENGETLTSDKCRLSDPKVTGTITKLTLASYCMSPKKANTSCQVNDNELIETICVNTKSANEMKRDKEKTVGKKKIDLMIPEKEKGRSVASSWKKTAGKFGKKSPESSVEKPLKFFDKLQIDSSKKEEEEKSEISAEENTEEPSKKDAFPKAVSQSTKVSNEEESKVSDKQESVESPIENPDNSEKRSSLDRNNENSNAGESKKVSLKQTGQKENHLKEKQTTMKKSMKTTSDRKQIGTTLKPSLREKRVSDKMSVPTLNLNNLPVKDVDITDHSGSSDDRSRKSSLRKNKLNEDKSAVNRSADAEEFSNNQAKNETRTKVNSSTTKAERSLETDTVLRPDIGTQTAPETPGSRGKRTYGFKRKNKVEPAEITHVTTDVQTVATSDIPSTSNPETEILVAEKPGSPEEKSTDICPSCKRLQIPMAESSHQYYNIHRDKRGRIFCEYCAIPNSIKVLHNKVDHKRLKCAGCGNFIRIRSSKSFRKSDNCPNCGQPQTRIQSPPVST